MIITVLRKPLERGGVIPSSLLWGTGALNIEACRVPIDAEDLRRTSRSDSTGKLRTPEQTSLKVSVLWNSPYIRFDPTASGRFPANLILSPTEAQGLDRTVGHLHGRGNVRSTVQGRGNGVICFTSGRLDPTPLWDGGGGPSRFFRILQIS